MVQILSVQRSHPGAFYGRRLIAANPELTMGRQAVRFDSAQLDRMFFALADTTRRGMLDQLSRGSASVSELASAYDMALPSVVKHLGVLEEGGLVSSSKTGRVRTYSITPAAFARMETWVAEHKAHLEAQFDSLDAWLAKNAMKKRPDNAADKSAAKKAAANKAVNKTRGKR